MLALQKIPRISQFDTVEAATGTECRPPKTATRGVTVTQPNGLHLRPCSAIVSTVGKHQASVTVQKGSQSVSAASIFELLSLAASPGTELVLSATGAESQEVLDAVAGLFANDFQGY